MTNKIENAVKKKSAFSAILQLKCPYCRHGHIFQSRGLYTIKNIGGMQDTCEHCGHTLKQEMGFYFGAAYCSYALTVAMWIAIVVALKTLNALGLIHYGFLTHPITFLTTGLVCTLLFFPYIFRVSRSMWLHMFKKN